MDDIELPEVPETEKEKREWLDTLIAVSVTLLVTFMAICKITDNNTVLHMQEAQAVKVDKWAWYQALNVREDIIQSRLTDHKDDLKTEADEGRKRTLSAKIEDDEKVAQKITDKKEKIKSEAESEEKRYEILNEKHEKFDQSEAAISIAVSLLAMTALLQKRWMYFVSLVPAFVGVGMGSLGLVS